MDKILRRGASREEWAHFERLGLTADLLPVVSNPEATISPNSQLRALGKVPSRYNGDRQVVGIKDWTLHRASPRQVEGWSLEPDYGICIQARAVRAIDIDLERDESVKQVLAVLGRNPKLAGAAIRLREGSPRALVGFRLLAPLEKRVISHRDGAIELLADGQQFIAAGTHPSGGRYFWVPDLPVQFPELTLEEFEAVWAELGGGAAPARAVSTVNAPLQGRPDPVADWLYLRGWVIDEKADQLQIICPWCVDHSMESGPTETVYYRAGTGGFELGHFKCLHAHCADRTDAQFLEAVGYRLADAEDFPVVEAAEAAEAAEVSSMPAARAPTDFAALFDGAEEPQIVARAGEESPVARWRSGRPGEALKAGKKGFAAVIENLVRALETPGFGWRLGWDRFQDHPARSTWNSDARDPGSWEGLRDADMVELRRRLGEAGFEPVGRELMRDAVELVTRRREFDSLQLWVADQRWDGVPRVDTFLERQYGAEPCAYTRAVSRYWWTALAGRALVPGVQADMVPVLTGMEGLRKTRGIEALAPWPAAYVTIDLAHRDAEIARKMRGRCVLELNELRGLQSRARDAIKSFVTERADPYRPLWKEFLVIQPRRCLFIGTTNDDEFLDDSTGNRRWLPVRVFRSGEVTPEERNQLWAEAAVLFLGEGVAWSEAERGARAVHAEFMVSDLWLDEVEAWLKRREAELNGEDVGFALHTAAIGIGLDPRAMKRGEEYRLGKCLRLAGYEKRQTWISGRNQKLWHKIGVEGIEQEVVDDQ